MSRLIQIIKEPHFVIFKDHGKFTCGSTEVINVFEDDNNVIHCVPAFSVTDVNHDTADELLADAEKPDHLYICEGMSDELFDELVETEKAENHGCYFEALAEVLRYMYRGKFYLFGDYRERLIRLREAIDKALEIDHE